MRVFFGLLAFTLPAIVRRSFRCAPATLGYWFPAKPGTGFEPMRSDTFNFEVPPQRIAQLPAARRDESRLMVVRRRRRD